MYLTQELEPTGRNGEKPGEEPTAAEKRAEAARMKMFFSKEQAQLRSDLAFAFYYRASLFQGSVIGFIGVWGEWNRWYVFCQSSFGVVFVVCYLLFLLLSYGGSVVVLPTDMFITSYHRLRSRSSAK